MTEQKPRVAILHYSAPPIIGGVETTIAAHARLFAERGYPVKIIAGRGEPFDARVPVKIIALLDSRDALVTQVNRELNAGTVNADFIALSEQIKHALVTALAEVDVCIAHNIATLHKNLAFTRALHELTQESRVPLIAWCHDFAWDDPVYADELHEGEPWNLLRQKWGNTKYVVVSESRQQDLARLLDLAQNEIAVVPPGLDATEFLGVGETVARWMHEFDLLAAAPLLLLPARVTRRKNIELALDLTAALCARGLAPKLVVMGPLGPHNPTNRAYLDALRDQAARLQIGETVLFLQAHGKVDDRARRDLYALADVLLFPSAREGFGIPILEAGLTRLPIFCADIPPFRESAGDNANYFALDESPSTIAARLAQFLANDSRYRLKQRVVHDYAWQNIFRERIEPLVRGLSR